MKKVKIILSLIFFVSVLLLAILYTPFGNRLLQPLLERQLQAQSGMELHIKRFRLTPRTIVLEIALSPSNRLIIGGKLSLLTQKYNLAYEMKIAALEELREKTGHVLHGELYTTGRIVGKGTSGVVEGSSDFAKSETIYSIAYKQFYIQKVVLHAKHIDTAKLLVTLAEEPYIAAVLNIDLEVGNLVSKNYDGEVHLDIVQGEFNREVFAKEFGVKIPKTTLKAEADAQIQNGKIAYNMAINSNLVVLKSHGSVKEKNLHTHMALDADIRELALLRPLTHMPLHGSLRLNAEANGNEEDMVIHAHSNVADSRSDLHVALHKMQARTLALDVEHMDVKKLLFMLERPLVTLGVLNLHLEMDSLVREHLKGKLQANLQGRLNGKYLTQEFELEKKVPSARYTLDTAATFAGSDANGNVKVRSSLGNLDMKNIIWQTQKESFSSDFVLHVPALTKLSFLTKRKFRGAFDMQGKIEKEQHLQIEGKSKIAQGVLQLHYVDNKTMMEFQDIHTKKLLWMAYYPQFMDAVMNGRATYDKGVEKGEARLKFASGRFTKNTIFDLAKRYTQTNLYKERFAGDANVTLDNKQIFSTFDLRSTHAEIRSTRTLFDPYSDYIDANLLFYIDKTPVVITLKGDVHQPAIGVDMDAFLRTKAGKRLQKKAAKEIEKFLQKLF